MEIKILLPVDSPKQGILNLKNFIDRAAIPGVEQTEIERGPHQNGQMGSGVLLNSISAEILAAAGPVSELVRQLQKYVDNYRTRITIPTKDGDIVLEHGRDMKTEQLQKMLVSIQNNVN